MDKKTIEGLAKIVSLARLVTLHGDVDLARLALGADMQDLIVRALREMAARE